MNRLDEVSLSMRQRIEQDTNIDQKRVYPKIAYILNSFPALSETFILQEILELERQELTLHLFSLAKPATGKRTTVKWEGRSHLTYLASHSKLTLLASAGRRLLKAPLCSLRVFLRMIKHYDLRATGRALFYAMHLSEQLEREQIRHLHAHYATESAEVAQAVHLLTGISYSFTAHAYDIYLSPKAHLAYKMSMARFVVTCTRYNQRYLTEIDERLVERIHCIYHGLNLRSFPTPMLANIRESQDSPCILAVSRLVEKKGLSYLVQACRILKDRGHRFTMRIVGEGPLREPLGQEIQELGLGDRILLSGAAAHKDVIGMYQQAAIVALPCIVSKNGDRDGIPNVLVEALYMGLPVISTPISGIPELISTEVNGLLVPPQDSAALADALARLLDDPELRNRLGTAGRQTVLERFDMARNTTHLLQLLFAPEEK
jgi:glycosyltransferase involved in cell wall biosynthesis